MENYLNGINKFFNENKDKDVSVKVSDPDIESKFGRYCSVEFTVDGVAHYHAMSTTMLLSILQLHASESLKRNTKP